MRCNYVDGRFAPDIVFATHVCVFLFDAYTNKLEGSHFRYIPHDPLISPQGFQHL